eukprot:scaffold912_cov108-Isochrysis_galbana.AAC.4
MSAVLLTLPPLSLIPFPPSSLRSSQERLIIAVDCQARAENAFETTRTWCNERVAFGKPLIAKQA